jgi:hypothetical protein
MVAERNPFFATFALLRVLRDPAPPRCDPAILRQVGCAHGPWEVDHAWKEPQMCFGLAQSDVQFVPEGDPPASLVLGEEAPIRVGDMGDVLMGAAKEMGCDCTE